jgi:hypothetical protein
VPLLHSFVTNLAALRGINPVDHAERLSVVLLAAFFPSSRDHKVNRRPRLLPNQFTCSFHLLFIAVSERAPHSKISLIRALDSLSYRCVSARWLPFAFSLITVFQNGRASIEEFTQ